MPSWDHRDPGHRTGQVFIVLGVLAVVLVVVALAVGTAKADGVLPEREVNPEGGAGQAQRWSSTGWSQVAEAPVAETDFGLIAEGRIVVGAPRSESTYQGKTAVWWARRAVQARKDANARGRTIRRLQKVARGRLAYPTGHWLDGAFLCIHRFERGAGGWQTRTGNGYHGGLQMDSGFQRTYGPAWARRAFGESAHLWPASVQISAAIHAWVSRGFGPWPTTRRMCGL